MLLASHVGIAGPILPRVAAALALAFCLLGALLAPARAEVPVPPLAARVTDLTSTLSSAERAALEAKLAAFEARKGTQIAVLMVATTEQETIEQYARRVLDQWKLGRKGIDDGALLLVAKDDRRLRIETQYGLEGVLPDAVAKRIVSEVIVPRFREQDFNGGIAAGVDRMIAVVDGEALPPPAARPARQARQAAHDDNRVESLMMLGFVMLFFVGSFLRATLGRFGGAGVTAGVGGVIAWVIAGSLVAALAVGVILFVLSLVIAVAGLAGLGRGSGRGGHWGGGWSGGGSWGGGSMGGGGWSGGGGSGGGGGASGSW